MSYFSCEVDYAVEKKSHTINEKTTTLTIVKVENGYLTIVETETREKAVKEGCCAETKRECKCFISKNYPLQTPATEDAEVSKAIEKLDKTMFIL